LAQPLLAAFIMVAWDLSMDPVWSNLVQAWIWQDGGAWFGVPVSNFLGWYLAVYLIYQSFALWIRTGSLPNAPGSVNFWRVAVLFHGVCAAGNLFVIGPAGVSVIMDASGATWRVSSILGASAIVSIFVMGAFTLLARVRLTARPLRPCA
jgi:putative membrane protein